MTRTGVVRRGWHRRQRSQTKRWHDEARPSWSRRYGAPQVSRQQHRRRSRRLVHRPASRPRNNTTFRARPQRPWSRCRRTMRQSPTTVPRRQATPAPCQRREDLLRFRARWCQHLRWCHRGHRHGYRAHRFRVAESDKQLGHRRTEHQSHGPWLRVCESCRPLLAVKLRERRSHPAHQVAEQPTRPQVRDCLPMLR